MQLERDGFRFPQFQLPFQAWGLYIPDLSIQVSDQPFQGDLHKHPVDLPFCEDQLLETSNLLFSDAMKLKANYKLGYQSFALNFKPILYYLVYHYKLPAIKHLPLLEEWNTPLSLDMLLIKDPAQ